MSRKDDWSEYRELFIHEMQETSKQFSNVTAILESLRRDIAAVKEEVGLVKVEVGGLKVKSLVAGGLAGIVVTGLVGFFFSSMK